MAFTAPAYAVNNIQTLDDLTENQASAVKILHDKAGSDTKTYLIALLAELASVTDSSSGADNIGMTPITETGAANKVQTVIEVLITRLKATTDGLSGADLTGLTAIAGVDGTTVQSFLEAFKTYVDSQSPLTIGNGSITDLKLSEDTGAIKARFTAYQAESTHLSQYCVGDGITNDIVGFLAAIATGKNIIGQSGKTYLVSDTLVFGDGFHDLLGATIKATVGLATKPVISISNKSNGKIVNCIIDGNNIAKQGIYGYHLNEAVSGFDTITVKNCTEDGFNLVGCQVSTGKNLYSLLNGRYGFYFASCNAFTLDTSSANGNLNDGVYIEKGVDNFSSGMQILSSTIQNNGGNGVNNVNAESPVNVKNCWFEGNTGHGVLNSGKAIIENNMIATSGTTDKYAIYITNTGRGVFKHNQLPTPVGFDGAHVYFANTGLSDDFDQLGVELEPNFTGVAGAKTTVVLAVSKKIYEITKNEFLYHAVKKLYVTDTVNYTKILTAKAQSSIDVIISAAVNYAGAQGQCIFKTWSSMSVDTRKSFAEIGGATNPWADNVFYSPVYLAGHGLYIRWNGDDLEIKPYNPYDNYWVIEVKAYIPSSGFYPTWLI